MAVDYALYDLFYDADYGENFSPIVLVNPNYDGSADDFDDDDWSKNYESDHQDGEEDPWS